MARFALVNVQRALISGEAVDKTHGQPGRIAAKIPNRGSHDTVGLRRQPIERSFDSASPQPLSFESERADINPLRRVRRSGRLLIFLTDSQSGRSQQYQYDETQT